jgi:hypothetical protein
MVGNGEENLNEMVLAATGDEDSKSSNPEKIRKLFLVRHFMIIPPK